MGSIFVCGTAAVEAWSFLERCEGVKLEGWSLSSESWCVKNTQTLLKGRQQVVLKVKWHDPYGVWVTVGTIFEDNAKFVPIASSIPVKHLVNVASGAISSQFTHRPHLKYTTSFNLISLYYAKRYTHIKFFYKPNWLLNHTVAHLYKLRKKCHKSRRKNKRNLYFGN